MTAEYSSFDTDDTEQPEYGHEQPPPSASRTRIAPWIATSIAVLLVPALLLPVLLTRAASPTLEVSPTAQLPGGTVRVTGSHLPGQINAFLTIDGDAASAASFHVDGGGEFAVDLHVPDAASPGTHEVAAVEGHPPTNGRGHDDIGEPLATVPLEVVSPDASATPTVSATASGVVIPGPTSTATGTPAPTATPTSQATATPSQSATQAPTPAPTDPPTPTPVATQAPTPAPTDPPTPTPASTRTAAPASAIKHVVMVWMENEEATSITSSSMPYLYGLSQTYGRAEEFYAVDHPSQPNYIALWSGSTQGVNDDKVHDITAPNLSSQLTAKGLEWRGFMQNYPSTPGCHTGSSYSGDVDGWGVAGTYVRKHDPMMSFTNVSGSASECAKIQPLANFNTNAPVTFVSPNLCNDMHDCSLKTGDAFLEAFLPQVFNSPNWPSTLLIVSFDEGDSGANGGGHIFTMVARQGMGHVVSQTTHDHYSVTRTIENLFGLPCLANACKANTIDEFLP